MTSFENNDESTIGVPESEIKNLTVLNKSDLAFAILYGFLFVIGFVLTVISI